MNEYKILLMEQIEVQQSIYIYIYIYIYICEYKIGYFLRQSINKFALKSSYFIFTFYLRHGHTQMFNIYIYMYIYVYMLQNFSESLLNHAKRYFPPNSIVNCKHTL